MQSIFHLSLLITSLPFFSTFNLAQRLTCVDYINRLLWHMFSVAVQPTSDTTNRSSVMLRHLFLQFPEGSHWLAMSLDWSHSCCKVPLSTQPLSFLGLVKTLFLPLPASRWFLASGNHTTHPGFPTFCFHLWKQSCSTLPSCISWSECAT